MNPATMTTKQMPHPILRVFGAKGDRWFIACDRGTLYEMIRELDAYQEESGGCDHSVGICNCEMQFLLQETEAWLKPSTMESPRRQRLPGSIAVDFLNETELDPWQEKHDPDRYHALAAARRDLLEGLRRSGTVLTTDRRCKRIRTQAPGEKCPACWDPIVLLNVDDAR